MTKLSDKEKTVIADLGINTEYQEHPVDCVKTIMTILGTTTAGAKAVLRSLKSKNILEEATDEEEEPIIQFTSVGIDEALKLNPIEDADLDPMPDDEDDMPEIDEVDLDEDDEDEAVTMVQKAAKKAKRKAAAKADSKKTPGATRTSHAGCSHPSTKADRAKCRKARALAAAK